MIQIRFKYDRYYKIGKSKFILKRKTKIKKNVKRHHEKKKLGRLEKQPNRAFRNVNQSLGIQTA